MEGNVKVHLNLIWHEGMDWIHLSEDGDMVGNEYSCSIKDEEFLDYMSDCKLLKKVMLHGASYYLLVSIISTTVNAMPIKYWDLGIQSRLEHSDLFTFVCVA
jgi:hypothetical protein